MGERLSELLTRTADLAGPERPAPTAREFRSTRITRRRKGFGIVTAVVVVALVATLAVALGGRNSGRPDPRKPAVPAGHRAIPTPDLAPPSGSVGVDRLKTYRWAAMPPAPIPKRSGSAYAWTGSELVIWGGASQDRRVFSDGAVYAPGTRTWTTMPRAPLSPRTRTASVWTGSALFVWGGNGSAIDASALNDGALYDPATRRWHKLPPVDIRPTTEARAVWTGNRVVLFTVVPAVHPTTVEVHAYDPITDRWTTAASIRVPQTEIMTTAAVVAGDQLWFWASVQTLAGNLTTGRDAYRYDPGKDTWERSGLLPLDARFDVRGPIWTGDHIFLAPGSLACTCGGPAIENTYGTWADPGSGARVRMPSWSEDDTDAGYVWTGAALVAAGGAVAWTPDASSWTVLATSPYAFSGDDAGVVTAWTGTELLVWGELYERPSRKPNAGYTPTVAATAGLEFGP